MQGVSSVFLIAKGCKGCRLEDRCRLAKDLGESKKKQVREGEQSRKVENRSRQANFERPNAFTEMFSLQENLKVGS